MNSYLSKDSFMINNTNAWNSLETSCSPIISIHCTGCTIWTVSVCLSINQFPPPTLWSAPAPRHLGDNAFWCTYTQTDKLYKISCLSRHSSHWVMFLKHTFLTTQSPNPLVGIRHVCFLSSEKRHVSWHQGNIIQALSKFNKLTKERV